MPTYDFIPTDTLFFRDQRPLAAGFSFGRGANWPLPTVLHSAIRTALLAERSEGLPARVSQPGNARKGEPHGDLVAADFQWLNLQGPFPVDKSGQLYFPIPRDLVAAEGGKAARLAIQQNSGANNLPKPLAHLAIPKSPPTKETLSDWVSLEFYQRYLGKEEPLSAPDRAELWDVEHRIGVALDPDTHTAVEHQLYAAEHLRVRDGVRLRFRISEDPHGKEIADLRGKTLQLGGEQRFGQVEAAETELQLPKTEISGNLVKWILLTPAIFVHGWRPGWVDESGHVLLRVVDRARRAERRRPRRESGWQYDPAADKAETISASLVAAVVGKPQVVGGWDTQAKPTQLAVPSGSVFYFEAKNESEAKKLAGILQGRCRSDFFGEKGLGLGVCGTWRPVDVAGRPVSGSITG
jgi:CRISPR-associated protein Cmr3